jgi:hypothetical protein
VLESVLMFIAINVLEHSQEATMNDEMRPLEMFRTDPRLCQYCWKLFTGQKDWASFYPHLPYEAMRVGASKGCQACASFVLRLKSCRRSECDDKKLGVLFTDHGEGSYDLVISWSEFVESWTLLPQPGMPWLHRT